MKIKIDLTAILAIFVVLFCNAGLMGFIKGSSIVTYLAYGCVLFWLILAFKNDLECFKKFIFICFPMLLFWIFLEITVLFVDDNISIYVSLMKDNVLFFLIFMIMFIYYSVPKRNIGRRFILLVWLIDTVLSSIYTIYRLIENPFLSRILATGNTSAYLKKGISTAGVLGYGSIYGLVLFVIALVWIIKESTNIKKVLMIFCGILFAYTILQAQFFIAVVVLVIGVIIALLWEKADIHKRFLRLLILLPCVVVGTILLLTQLPKILSLEILPDMVQERLQMFLEINSVDYLFTTSRGLVYLKSLNAIKDSLGIGIIFLNTQPSGGHSEVLDMIAYYGVFFTALFLFGILKMKHYIQNIIPIKSRRNYNIVWLIFLIISIINTSLWCTTTVSLFLIIPLMYIEIQSESDRKCLNEDSFD